MAIIGLAQQQLRKAPFEAFQELLDACRYEDIEKSGSMSQSNLRRICRANRVPLPDDMLLTLMEMYVKTAILLQISFVASWLT